MTVLTQNGHSPFQSQYGDGYHDGYKAAVAASNGVPPDKKPAQSQCSSEENNCDQEEGA